MFVFSLSGDKKGLSALFVEQRGFSELEAFTSKLLSPTKLGQNEHIYEDEINLKPRFWGHKTPITFCPKSGREERREGVKNPPLMTPKYRPLHRRIALHSLNHREKCKEGPLDTSRKPNPLKQGAKTARSRSFLSMS